MNNIERITNAIAKAECLQSKLTPELLAIDGMSSARVRHFLNNLVTPEDRYLEIGVWKGSTFCAANFGNHPKCALAVDNWVEFGGPRDACVANFRKHLAQDPWELIDSNCFDLDAAVIAPPGGFNIYLYDGGHDVVSHTRALTHFEPALAPEFILIVDDWNMAAAKEGTEAGLKKAGIEVLLRWELPARYNGDYEQWWDGLFVAACRRTLVAK